MAELYSSVCKGTQVWRADFNGRAVVVKHVYSGNQQSLSRLGKEAHYYALLRECNSVPSMISMGDDYLMTEYVDAETVWQRGAREDFEFFPVMRQLSSMLADFNDFSGDCKPSRFKYWIWFIRTAIGQAKRLLLSGPKSTVVSRGNYLLCQFLYWLALPLSLVLLTFIGFLCSFLYLDQMGKRYHGDLHGNNVLLSDSGRIFVVDYESVIEKPGRVFDFSYFVATTVWVSDRCELGRMTRACFPKSGFLFRVMVRALVSYMVVCSGLNSRFRRWVDL